MAKWHGISRPCPKCEIELVITDFFVNADEGLCFSVVCEKCEFPFQWVISWDDFSQIIKRCLLADAVHPVNKNVDLSEQDKKFLSDCHIKTDDKST